MSVDYYNQLMSTNGPCSKKSSSKAKASRPRKPMSGYLYFSQVLRPKLARENQMSPTDVLKAVGKMWNRLGTDVRDTYSAAEQLDRAKYRQLLAQWSQAELVVTVANAKGGADADALIVGGPPDAREGAKNYFEMVMRQRVVEAMPMDKTDDVKVHSYMQFCACSLVHCLSHLPIPLSRALPIPSAHSTFSCTAYPICPFHFLVHCLTHSCLHGRSYVQSILDKMWAQLHPTVKSVYEAQAKQSEARHKQAVASWATAQLGLKTGEGIGDSDSNGSGVHGSGNARVASLVAEQQRQQQVRQSHEQVRQARLKWPEMISSGLVKPGDKVLTARIVGHEFHADLKHNR
jgi:hypothetical protein